LSPSFCYINPKYLFDYTERFIVAYLHFLSSLFSLTSPSFLLWKLTPILDAPMPILGLKVKREERDLVIFEDNPTISMEKSRRKLSVDMFFFIEVFSKIIKLRPSLVLSPYLKQICYLKQGSVRRVLSSLTLQNVYSFRLLLKIFGEGEN